MRQLIGSPHVFERKIEVILKKTDKIGMKSVVDYFLIKEQQREKLGKENFKNIW